MRNLMPSSILGRIRIVCIVALTVLIVAGAGFFFVQQALERTNLEIQSLDDIFEEIDLSVHLGQ